MRALALVLSMVLLSAGHAQAGPPSVVVTIKPIHSLVAEVMEGIGTPELLVKGAADEHSYALHPSDARALARADLIVWVGPNLEGFMKRPLETLAGRASKLELMSLPSLTRLKMRKGGTWEADEEERGEETGSEENAQQPTYNPHIWLDPKNAEAIVNAVAGALTKADPTHAQSYAANAARTLQRLDKLDENLRMKLAPIHQRPFVVFHDAYPYFEHRYHLNAVGSITTVPQVQPSAQRVRQIKEKIRTLEAVCVFSEPQFEPRLVNTLIEGTSAKHGTLDAIGAGFNWPELYFTLLENLASDLNDCLLKRA